MRPRRATDDDCLLLGEWNHQLIEDEGHRNTLSPPELAERMRGWLAEPTHYRAVLFENDAEPLGYALYWEEPERVYLRHLFVRRDRRSRGVGRACLGLLRAKFWPRGKRVVVEVLWGNPRAAAFYRAAGFADYSLALELPPE